MEKDTMYEYLENLFPNTGCLNCPHVEECCEESQYTCMDEYGTCPIKNIVTEEDYNSSSFPEN